MDNIKKRNFKNNFFKIFSFLFIIKIIFLVLILIGSIFVSGYSAFFITIINLDEKNQNTLNQQEMDLLFIKDETGILYPTYALDSVHKGTLKEAKNQEDQQLLDLYQKLKEWNAIKTSFNIDFLIHSDSINPHKAGLGAAIIGTLYILFIVVLITVPFGIAAGIYCNEFLPIKVKKWVDPFILNMAAIPSIIYGLIGLVIFIQFFHLPRSSGLVGGLVLSFLVLPQMIVIAQEALKAVPQNLREATLAMGATKIQTIWHHVLPWAMRPILTSIVLSFARVIGETAPLLMIGMVAFIASPASSPLEPTSTLPVQIFLWSKNPDPSFVEKTSGAILILILLLILVNAIVAFLRHKMKRVQ
jgi:phosphate transport system permease protein